MLAFMADDVNWSPCEGESDGTEKIVWATFSVPLESETPVDQAA